MANENPSTNSDLELAEQLQIANEQLQIANNEVARLREMRKEEENLWSGIESRLLCSTKGILNGIISTAQENKAILESNFSTCSQGLHSLKMQVQDLSSATENNFQIFESKVSLCAHAIEALKRQVYDLSLEFSSETGSGQPKAVIPLVGVSEPVMTNYEATGSATTDSETVAVIPPVESLEALLNSASELSSETGSRQIDSETVPAIPLVGVSEPVMTNYESGTDSESANSEAAVTYSENPHEEAPESVVLSASEFSCETGSANTDSETVIVIPLVEDLQAVVTDSESGTDSESANSEAAVTYSENPHEEAPESVVLSASEFSCETGSANTDSETVIVIPLVEDLEAVVTDSNEEHDEYHLFDVDWFRQKRREHRDLVKKKKARKVLPRPRLKMSDYLGSTKRTTEKLASVASTESEIEVASTESVASTSEFISETDKTEAVIPSMEVKNSDETEVVVISASEFISETDKTETVIPPMEVENSDSTSSSSDVERNRRGRAQARVPPNRRRQFKKKNREFKKKEKHTYHDP